MTGTRRYHWYCLFGAILLEVSGTTVMKLAHSWTFPHAVLCGLLLMWAAVGCSYYLLSLATTGLPVGVAYAFWEGFGLALVTVSSIFILKEPMSITRAFGLLCVVSGAFLVNFGTGHGAEKPKKQTRGKREGI